MNDKCLSDKISDLRKWQERQQQFLVDILNSEGDCSQNQTQGTDFIDNADYIEENDVGDDFEFRPKFNVLPRIEECDDLSDRSMNDDHNNACEEPSMNVSNSQSVIDVDKCLVVPGIDGKRIKTFEDLIEEKLRGSNKNQNSSPSVVKRPFLKKGEGLKKFQSLGTKNISAHKTVKFRNSKPPGARMAVKPSASKKVPVVGTRAEIPVPTHRKVQRICKQNIERAVSKSAVHRKKLDVLPTHGRIEKNFPIQDFVVKEWKSDFSEDTSSDDFATYSNYFDNKSHKKELNSKSHSSKSTDVAQLEKLLEFIQIKKDDLKKKIEKVNLSSTSSEEESEREYDRKRRKKKSKKKSAIVEEHRLIADLSQPTENHYASKLKEEIKSLESKLSSLHQKCSKNEQENMCKQKKPCEIEEDTQVSKKLFGEVSKLREQISLLVNRMNAIELQSAQNTGEVCKKSNVAKAINQKKPCVIKHSKDSPSNLQKLDIQSDANSTTVTYENGDQMTVCNDNISIYKYASNGATQTTFPDGLRVIEFPNGQIERIYKNGIKHIYYPNQFQRIINPNGSEEIITEDGTTIRISSEGNEIVDLPNGEREIRTKDFKKREYANGTVKVVYNDGTQETRYSNGRLKIKDADGNVVVDSFVRTLQDL